MGRGRLGDHGAMRRAVRAGRAEQAGAGWGWGEGEGKLRGEAKGSSGRSHGRGGRAAL